MNAKALLLALGLSVLPVAAQQSAVPDAEAAKHVGESTSVTGKVVTVRTTSKGMTFMNFGDSFPRHTFSGVIFGRSAEAVGDVKQYEGKEVVLSGRIETGPDQKPQIVINSADQLKLAGAAPAPAPAPVVTKPMTPSPAPAPMAAPVPAPTEAPVPSAPVGDRPAVVKQISLASSWSPTGRGGELPRKDLAKLFGGCGAASEETKVTAPCEVYPGVPFLTSLNFARKALKLDGAASTRAKVVTPGLPVGSLTATNYSGIFPGGFDRMFIITDNADQVVSVLLVDSKTDSRVQNETDTTGYHTYNFITMRSRATNDLYVKHQIDLENAPEGTVVVNTMLIDPTDPETPAPVKTTRSSSGKSSNYGKPKTGKVMERSRWFVPRPMVNLIMRCVTQ